VRDGVSGIVRAGRIAAVTRVDSLYDGLSIGPIIGPYNGRCLCILSGKHNGRESECVKICPFGDSSILENYQEARIIDPLDLKAAINVLPLCESGLDVSRF